MRNPDPAKAVQLLDLLLQFFGEHGEHWTHGVYNDGYGKRCLVNAIDYLHHEHGSTGRGLTDYLGAAIWPGQQPEYTQGDFVIFNDSGKTFKRIRTVIVKARALAQRDLEERYPEIAAANAVAAQKGVTP
jgi:hypothetical protein